MTMDKADLRLADKESLCQAPRELYRENRSLMFVLAIQILGNTPAAEDAVYDGFAQAVSRENGTKKRVLNPRQMRRYLLTAVKYAAADQLQEKKGKDYPAALWEEIDMAIRPERVEPSGAVNILEQLVWKTVGQLKGTYRDVFLLNYSLCLSCGEIGGLLGFTESSVELRLIRGKKILKRLLEGEGLVCTEIGEAGRLQMERGDKLDELLYQTLPQIDQALLEELEQEAGNAVIEPSRRFVRRMEQLFRETDGWDTGSQRLKESPCILKGRTVLSAVLVSLLAVLLLALTSFAVLRGGSPKGGESPVPRIAGEPVSVDWNGGYIGGKDGR